MSQVLINTVHTNFINKNIESYFSKVFFKSFFHLLRISLKIVFVNFPKNSVVCTLVYEVFVFTCETVLQTRKLHILFLAQYSTSFWGLARAKHIWTCFNSHKAPTQMAFIQTFANQARGGHVFFSRESFPFSLLKDLGNNKT